MSRDRHSKKEVEKALAYAEDRGWVVARSSGRSAHAWGVMRCPTGECQQGIFSTPRSPENMAKRIRKAVIRCPHGIETS
jgi:hypothetical protein